MSAPSIATSGSSWHHPPHELLHLDRARYHVHRARVAKLPLLLGRERDPNLLAKRKVLADSRPRDHDLLGACSIGLAGDEERHGSTLLDGDLCGDESAVRDGELDGLGAGGLLRAPPSSKSERGQGGRHEDYQAL